jgi:hypothetical protein
MDNISAVLQATLKDVADVPDPLKEVAFTKVFDLRAGTAPAAAPPSGQTPQQPAPQQQAPLQQGDASGEAASGDPLAAIAVKAGTTRDIAAEVFEVAVKNGEVRLIVPTGKLPTQTAAATKEIALAIAGARQAAGIDEWTSWGTVRDVCQEFKRLDDGNFAKTIRSMEDEFNFRKESARKTMVKVSRPGWEAFGVLVKRLGGDTTA